MKPYQLAIASGVAIFCSVFTARFLTSVPPEFVESNYYLLQPGAAAITTFPSRISCEAIRSSFEGAAGECVLGAMLVKAGDRRYYAFTANADDKVDRVAGAFENKDSCERIALAIAAPGTFKCGQLSR